jgi:hypothetical protein
MNTIREMGKHKKKSKAAAPAPGKELTPEQIQQQKIEERLQIYGPDKRELMRQQILQRKQGKKKKHGIRRSGGGDSDNI